MKTSRQITIKIGLAERLKAGRSISYSEAIEELQTDNTKLINENVLLIRENRQLHIRIDVLRLAEKKR